MLQPQESWPKDDASRKLPSVSCPPPAIKEMNGSLGSKCFRICTVGLVELNAQKGCSWAEFDSCVMGINNVLEKIEMFGKDPCR